MHLDYGGGFEIYVWYCYRYFWGWTWNCLVLWFSSYIVSCITIVSLLCCDAFMHPNSYGGSMSGAAKDGRWILNSSLPYKNQRNVALSGKANSEVKEKEMEPQFDSTILNYESSDGNSNNLMICDESVEDTNVKLATTKSLSKKTFLKIHNTWLQLACLQLFP